MNKKLFIWALTLLCVSAFPYKVYAANEEPEHGISLEVGADLVSSYLWRGYNVGGLSIQPSVTFGWNGLYLCGWANIGADNWKFQELNPELDITIGYDNYGFQLDLTHLYYFGGEKYFFGMNDPNNAFGSSTMELHAGINIGEWAEKVPLTLDWYTTIYGADCYLNEAGEWQRAWSTYVQVGYTFGLPLGIDLTTNVGFTPWRGMYSNYDEVWKNAKTVAINNLHLRAERYFEMKGVELGIWGECMLNCYGLDKTNLTTNLENKFDQRLNWGVGGCLYFSSEW